MEIKIATTKKELDSVYKLRYKVYVEEEQKFGKVFFSEKMMKDEFDEDINTVSLIMVKDEQVIGAIRITKAQRSSEKLPSDKLYNFDQTRDQHPGQFPASVGMLAILKSHRNLGSFIALMKATGKLLLNLNADYTIFTLNHECTRLISRITGAAILSEKVWVEEIQNHIIPMILYKEQIASLIPNVPEVKILDSGLQKVLAA